jgi:flagellin
VSGEAATFGAVQNRLQYALPGLSTSAENLSAATSSIRDVDIAAAMTSLTSKQILEQSGIAVLSQAQKEPQAVLSLLR